MIAWTETEKRALRALLGKIPPHVLKDKLMADCPATLSVEDVKTLPEKGIANVALIRTGWEACITKIVEVAQSSSQNDENAGHLDFSKD